MILRIKSSSVKGINHLVFLTEIQPVLYEVWIQFLGVKLTSSFTELSKI
jgi:hypothetical protein